jgi:hypothetical protein
MKALRYKLKVFWAANCFDFKSACIDWFFETLYH